MAFGKRLVDEYGLDSEVDTLGRWLVHHIAALIRDADDVASSDSAARRAAAANAILKFWEHRRSQDRIDPLRDLKPLLNVIKTLNPDENRWGTYRGDGTTALWDFYSAVRQIIIFLLLARSKTPAEQVEESKFLSDEETAIILSLNVWLAEYQKEALKAKPKRRSRKRQPEASRP